MQNIKKNKWINKVKDRQQAKHLKSRTGGGQNKLPKKYWGIKLDKQKGKWS